MILEEEEWDKDAKLRDICQDEFKCLFSVTYFRFSEQRWAVFFTMPRDCDYTVKRM